MGVPSLRPPSQLQAMRADGSRLAIHPADVRGRFIRARRAVFVALIGVYLLVPLVNVGGHPAVHLDLPARHFYLFGKTYNAQDVSMVVSLAIAFVFGLLFLTAWRGRLWCGWACPQTVFLEAVYRPIERLFDGPRERRMRRGTEPWTYGRVLRTGGKHFGYLAASLAIAHVATSLFVSARGLTGMIVDGPAHHAVPFVWSMAFTGLLYFNFGWFREQFCIVLCPYGRLQSVMHDRDSVIIGYDARRGEPRGHLKQTSAEPLGDCIDCKKCVYACPTAIDIRNGLQMECLACAQCIDACDEVMDKVGRPRGLIRYASLNELAGKSRVIVRPRLVGYAAVFGIAGLVLALRLSTRVPFEANGLRMRGPPYILEGDSLRNQFEIHLVNKSPERTTYTLNSAPPFPADVRLGQDMVTVDSLGSVRVPVIVRFQRGDFRPGQKLIVRVVAQGSVEERDVQLPLLGVGAP